jgi:hypothetical protein
VGPAGRPQLSNAALGALDMYNTGRLGWETASSRPSVYPLITGMFTSVTTRLNGLAACSISWSASCPFRASMTT